MENLAIPSWAWGAGAQLWSFVATALIAYQGVEIAKRFATHWKIRGEGSWFDDGLPVYPLLVGALVMQIPWPVLAAIDALDKSDGWWPEMWARAGWGALAGALCGQVFEIVQLLARGARRRVARLVGEPSSADAEVGVIDRPRPWQEGPAPGPKPQPRPTDPGGGS